MDVSQSYKTCQACHDEREAQALIAMPCNHYWCHDCLSRVCSSIKYEGDLPIACGGNCHIPESVALKSLSPDEAKLFERKLAELKIPARERNYCANRNCGEFIPPVSQELDILALCQECGQSTCKQCHALKHEGECAGPSEDDKQAFALIRKEGYQTCSECSRVVERSEGCSHMTCCCGYEFCYHCGGPVLTCNGCAHLEPDTAHIQRINDTMNYAVEAARLIAEELLYLRFRTPPESPRGLTGWFNRHLRENSGYIGFPIFFDDEFHIQYVLEPASMADQEELVFLMRSCSRYSARLITSCMTKMTKRMKRNMKEVIGICEEDKS